MVGSTSRFQVSHISCKADMLLQEAKHRCLFYFVHNSLVSPLLRSCFPLKSLVWIENFKKRQCSVKDILGRFPIFVPVVLGCQTSRFPNISLLTALAKQWWDSFLRLQHCFPYVAFSTDNPTLINHCQLYSPVSANFMAVSQYSALNLTSNSPVLLRRCNPFGVLSMRSYCSKPASFSLEQRTFDGTSPMKNDDDIVVDKVYETVMDHTLDMEKALDQLGLGLGTNLVVETLRRLHYEEKIAFRFFSWAGRQPDYEHEPCAYNEMIDILSSTKYKTKQFRIVCDMLDYMKRSKRSTVPIEVLLTILRNYTQKYLTHVQKFAKKKRIRVKTQPEINAFNLLLDALCKCCLVEDAEAMLRRVKGKVKPDVNTYNILFFGWCRMRNPSRGMKVLDEMIQLGHSPDNFTYNTAIDAFCKAGMLSEASELFEFMRTKGSTMSSPTAKTYAILMAALAQNGRMNECFELLGQMINSGCLPDVSTYKELIEGMCLAGKIDEAHRLLQEMANKGYPLDIVSYNCFLKVLCENKKTDEALGLYERMINEGCLPSVQTYNMLISMFFKAGDTDGAFETWQEMDKRGCARDVDTYSVMIDGLFDCNRPQDACFLIEEVVDMGLKMPYRKFDNLLMRLSDIGNLRAIHKLSEHMRRFYNPSMARRFALSQKRKSMSFRGK